MGAKYAAARHRGDVAHLRQDAGVAQEAYQAKVIQARAESAPGKGQTDFLHGAPMHVGPCLAPARCEGFELAPNEKMHCRNLLGRPRYLPAPTHSPLVV